MARVHKWYFLVNQAGEPIEGASVWITLAGTGGKTGVPAWIYFDEFGSSGTRTVPQLTTLENGYFEFWIDEDEDFDVCNTSEVDDATATSYGFNQKFCISWDKPTIASGLIDYVDIFPPNRYFQPADLTSCSDTLMNKVVSNELACLWNEHSTADIRVDPYRSAPTLIHGFELLDTTEPNDIANKIITNNQGWLWDIHEASTVHEFALSGFWELGGQQITDPPHDIRKLDTTDTGVQWSKWNKVVSNEYMYNIEQDLAAIKFDIFTISSALTAGVDAIWSLGADGYETTLNHALDIEFPNVTCYGRYGSEWMLMKTAEVEYVNTNNLKITINHDIVHMKVRVST